MGEAVLLNSDDVERLKSNLDIASEIRNFQQVLHIVLEMTECL